VDEMVDRTDATVLCLGLGDMTAENIVEQCIKYDEEGSWTYGLSREYILKHAQDWQKQNEMLKEECPKYGIRYIDTSKNRADVLNNIIKELEESK
jgi:hypothetical protein